nr:hypothetical protein [uncultured Agathobaculum sp.]
MAKNKVINTVLTLRDNMSGGLLKAAKNAQKANKQITNDMITATRQVVAFKNKAVDGITSFAKTAVGVGVAGATALTTAFIALDSATEEYRVAMGKLNTAFDAAGFSAESARKSYRNFYAILGDTDTATEASQLLAKLAENEQDVSTWTRIAAGVSGTFGDSLPIEGLIEASNETAKVGQVTGVLADALNWAGIMEDDFNEKLEACGSESKRNRLIMDTLAQTYEGAATAFYRNNKQIVDARRNQATLDEITAKLGDTSALVKTRLWEMFGAAEDGSLRGGSALAWLNEKADLFSDWVANLDMDELATQFDQKFAAAVDAAKDALQWCKDNADTLSTALKTLGVAFATVKIIKFTGDLVSAISIIGEFSKTVKKLITLKTTEIYCWVRSTLVVNSNKAALLAHKAVGAVRWIADQTLTLVTNAVQWAVDTAAIGANKAALLAHKVVGGAQWLLTQAASLAAASAAWIHNTAMMAVNKAGQLASAAASGIATGATAALTAAQWALNAAFVATPFGWIVMGLAAVVAGGVALYKNWETVKATAVSLWNKVKEVFSGIKNAIVGAFNSAKSAVGSFFTWLDNKIESIPILGSLYSGGKALVGGAADFIGGLISGNALGTSYWKGGLTRVNERGGEILNLPSGTQIIPHDVSARMAGGPQVTVNVTVAGNIIGNRQYADELGETIVQRILRALDNM